MKPIHMANWAASGPGIICAKASPCLYSSLVIHPRGTRSRCMYPASAIGPPKPNEPNFRKYMTRSHSPTDAGFEFVWPCILIVVPKYPLLFGSVVFAQIVGDVRYLIFLNTRTVRDHLSNDTRPFVFRLLSRSNDVHTMTGPACSFDHLFRCLIATGGRGIGLDEIVHEYVYLVVLQIRSFGAHELDRFVPAGPIQIRCFNFLEAMTLRALRLNERLSFVIVV